MSKSVEEKCSEVLSAYFQKHPVKEAPVLKPFTPESDALLQPLFNYGNKQVVPCDPDQNTAVPFPSLLLYDLENLKRKNTAVYEHIKAKKKQAASALYGTSGAGKTRSIFEYLSHNKGFYFLAGDHEKNAGSRDLESIFVHFGETATLNDGAGLAQSEKNLQIIQLRVQVLIYVRHLVHRSITKQLGREITPYEWLLLQLYPKTFLGDDVFHTAVSACFFDGDVNLQSAISALRMVDFELPVSFIDEAQRLLIEYRSYFLSTDGTVQRSAFSALLKAFTRSTLINGKLGFPVFSGTGLSIDELTAQSGSGTAKKPQVDTEPYFTNFETLGADAVKVYLLVFLVLDEVGKEVLEHIAKWLRGRPRWTATFLETYLVRTKKSRSERTRGRFNKSEGMVVEGLDRYISVMTTEGEDTTGTNRRHSWSAGEASAYAAIKKVKDPEVTKALEKAIFNFSVGGKPSYLEKDTKWLIEIGVAAVSVEQTASDNFVGVLDKPIVVQAGINFFNLETNLQGRLLAQEGGGQGEGFEKLMLPAFQDRRRLQGILENQLGTGHGFEGYLVSAGSSYGVLALDCKGDIARTIEWIESAASAQFEGLVPPFCYADDNFGPDVMFLMWNNEYTEFRTALAQAKLRKEINQLEALRTLVPKWLYHESRSNNAKRSSKVNDELWEKWKIAEAKLIRDDIPCLRLMVQYPANRTSSAEPGPIHDDNAKRCSGGMGCKRKHDCLLAVVCGMNGGDLFGNKTLDVLEHLKGLPAHKTG
jgi:hypothetical protein